MTPEEIRAFFARRHEALARHDAAALAAGYAEDCVVESPIAGTVKGRAAVEKVPNLFTTAFPDLAMEGHEVLAVEDRAVVTTTFHGTDTGGWLGQAPTGKRFAFFVVFFYTFHNGQIVHERRVYDLHGLMLQLTPGYQIGMQAAHEYRTALDRALMEHELKIAGEIQQALMPRLQRKGTEFEVAAVSVPCRAIGGDFVDYFDLPNEGFGFALGDVTGKGPPAALLAAELQGVLAAHSNIGGTPADTVSRVNQVLVRIESRFATMLYGQLACGGRLTYCNAGHNPPVLVGRRGIRRLETGGLILGAFKQATFEEETVQLDPGDVLVVYSDGVTEAFRPDGQDFGEEQLLSCLSANREAAPAVLLERLLGAVHEFTIGAVQSDDLTALVLRYAGL